MAYYSRNRIERVSEALQDLKYDEMLGLCEALTDMAIGRSGFDENISREGIANLLSDWAKFVEEQAAEQSAKAGDNG